MHKYTVVVRETLLDSFGHVNNARYLELFEEARWDLITAHGYDLGKIQSTRIGPVILGVTLKFKKELLPRTEIVIETQMNDYRGKIGTLSQVMRLPDDTIACEAVFTLAVMDLDKRKIIPPPEEWLNALQTKAVDER
ncbi:MAG: thioesterase family protein [Bdellovibrionales bacterium]|nr:thioesterase family protein [Bdellovibrionales bacterium]